MYSTPTQNIFKYIFKTHSTYIQHLLKCLEKDPYCIGIPSDNVIIYTFVCDFLICYTKVACSHKSIVLHICFHPTVILSHNHIFLKKYFHTKRIAAYIIISSHKNNIFTRKTYFHTKTKFFTQKLKSSSKNIHNIYVTQQHCSMAKPYFHVNISTTQICWIILGNKNNSEFYNSGNCHHSHNSYNSYNSCLIRFICFIFVFILKLLILLMNLRTSYNSYKSCNSYSSDIVYNACSPYLIILKFLNVLKFFVFPNTL